MIGAVARKLFGSANDRRIRSYAPRVDAINALENEVAALSDDELKARTERFKAELADGKTLDDILVPAFATVREAAKRTLGQRHFDVQLIGGMILHEGTISEMKTGEGKTLVATLPVYLNALAGRGVHVVTVNDYLAKRDSEWMGQIYNFLGLTTGVIVHGMDDERAQEGVCQRHHLRHQQRARLRLSARQHEVPAGGHGPARARLCDRRRSRLHPDRRGAHAADHLRSARRPFRFLQHHRRLHSAPRQDRLRGRREAAHRLHDRSRHGKDGDHAARCRPPEGRASLRSRERLDRASRQSGPARAQAVRSATRITSSATARS